ncbi:hypothetical protein BDV93DRAFT_529121, partial [Ceratobasidium sp. AG-I]
MSMHAGGRSEVHVLDEEDVSGTVFHFGFDGSLFMFRSLRITSWPTFAVACLITVVLCLSERYLTYLMSTKWTPLRRRGPVAVSIWRSLMYWVVTLERMIYMLIGMTLHAGLILVAVTALSIGQFFIELQEAKSSSNSGESYHPLLNSADMDNDPYTDPPTSLFPFTPAPAPRSANHATSQLRAQSASPPQPSLLTPGYRAPPPRAATLGISDVGRGNGRDRARELMSGG